MTSASEKLRRKARWQWRLLRVRAHLLTKIIPHPDAANWRLGRDTDEQENADTSPPADFDAAVQCVWAFELYTPSDIAQLERGLSALGINKSVHIGERDVVSNLKDRRERSGGGSWTNLGLLVSEKGQELWGMARRAPLPEGIEWVSLDLFQLTSSITAIGACFKLTKDWQARPLAILKTYQATRHEPRLRSTSIYSPSNLKEREIERYRREIRRTLHSWFSHNLPGLFARSPIERFPSCEYLRVSDAKKLTYRLEGILGVADFRSWRSKDWPGVNLVWPLRRDEGMDFHAVLVADLEELKALDTSSYGGGRPDVYPEMFDRDLKTALVRWSILSGLQSLQARLSQQRDRKLGLPANADAALRVMQGLVIEAGDIHSICSDLGQSAPHSYLWYLEGADFVASERQGPKDYLFSKLVQDNVKAAAKDVSELDARLKALALQQSTLLATSANLRLQRFVWWLAAATALLGLIAAVEPAAKIYDCAVPIAGQHAAEPSPICRPVAGVSRWVQDLSQAMSRPH